MVFFMIYQIHRVIDAILRENLFNNVFTSCEVGFFYNNGKEYKKYLYYLDKNIISFNSNFYFDLASLTKILVTVPCIWSLLSEDKIRLTSSINDIYSEVNNNIFTIGDLVNHISGLDSHKFFCEVLRIPMGDRIKYVEKEIFENFSLKRKGEYIYSDLGYILLGRIIEKISGKKLDEYWFEKVYKPLGLSGFFFSEKFSIDKKYIIQTGICPWSKKRLQGIVHDDNCRLLGGVCGHAGLFGNCFSLLDFFVKILLIYKNFVKCTTLSNNIFTENINKNVGGRRFGFDTPAKEKSSCGDFFSKLTIGHLGFTGTSVWMDLEKEIGIILLTNRTIYGNNNNIEEIRKLRPEIHNVIMKNIPHK